VPLFVEGRPIPPRWAEIKAAQPTPIDTYSRRADSIHIAFINNMPDAALEDTELQFFELLDATAGEIPVRIRLHSLPGIPRGERGRQRLKTFYFEFDDLWNERFDAVIVTGTEPCTPRLQNEPYWPMLAELIDWAESNTISAVWSCLAAHASVLRGDGIERRRLSDKKFGVFEFSKITEHMLTKQTDKVRFPHSRWNEVPAHELIACGYVILTHAADAGVDCFVKNREKSLFVHFQGHPEYVARTLLKEYRRDIKRFLKGERDTYPSMPQGYFDQRATTLLTNFRETALSDPREEVMAAFPEAAVVTKLDNGWQSCATSIYRNWLQHVKSRKREAPALVALSPLPDQMYRRRSAAP
jgi:homoserine O-succinyltransferase